jgi:hypothetical protein
VTKKKKENRSLAIRPYFYPVPKVWYLSGKSSCLILSKSATNQITEYLRSIRAGTLLHVNGITLPHAMSRRIFDNVEERERRENEVVASRNNCLMS